MAGYVIGLIGMWIMSDGLYSIALYLRAPSFREGNCRAGVKIMPYDWLE